MSCKYCELKMRPIDGGVKILKGENWSDDYAEGGYIEQSHDDIFRMHIIYDAGYAYTSVNNIKYCPFCGAELTMPKEPLIKDEKVRKAVRTWATADEVTKVYVYAIGGGEYSELYAQDNGVTDGRIRMSIKTQAGIDWGDEYTITELCGEEEE